MEKPIFQTTLLDKAKAANNDAQIDNLSERSISEIVNLFHPQFVEDDKITDDLWKLPVQMILTMSGQLRHDTSEGINAFKTKFENENKEAQAKAIADALKTAKAEWEKEHKPNQTDDDDPNKNKEDIDKKVADAVAAALGNLTGEEGAIGKLSKQLSSFLTQQAEKEKAASEAEIRQQIHEYLLSRGADEDDFAFDYTLEKLVIGENPDVAALKAKAEKDYEANYKKIHKNDGAFPPFGGGGQGDDEQGAKAWLKNREGSATAEQEAAEARRKLLK